MGPYDTKALGTTYIINMLVYSPMRGDTEVQGLQSTYLPLS